MKNYITILIISLCALPVYADSTAINTLVVNAATTMSVSTSGVLTTNINAETGELANVLSINYKITANKPVQDVKLRALVYDSNEKPHSAFCYTGGNSSSQNAYLIFASSSHPPEENSIINCAMPVSTPLQNPDSIAYPATVRINNNGIINYNNEGCFSCAMKEYTTDLNMSVATVPKPGTYDSSTAMDEPDSYKVEIYLDNILE